MKYRLGRKCHDLVYLQHGDQPDHDDDVRVAIFFPNWGAGGFSAEQLATAFVRTANATLPDCGCYLICRQCAEPTGTGPTGCEACTEHRMECTPDADPDV